MCFHSQGQEGDIQSAENSETSDSSDTGQVSSYYLVIICILNLPLSDGVTQLVNEIILTSLHHIMTAPQSTLYIVQCLK